MAEGRLYPIHSDKHHKRVILPQYFWFGREPLELRFPKDWTIDILEMEGDRLPILDADNLSSKIFDPLGTAPLSELAKGKQEVAIVVDDMSRPTEASRIVPHILGVLTEAGIPDEKIRFLISLGCHGAHTREDFVKKLGENIVRRFGIYNHNCYENCINVGRTRNGLPLKINKELMHCDLKIGIGAILPHLYTGYSGGGKLFLPGMAHVDTIDRFHSFTTPGEKGKIDNRNPMISEIEDALSSIGVDYLVNVLVNTKGKIIDLIAGNPSNVYEQGRKKAAKVYATPLSRQYDVIVSNAHLKVNEGDIALLAGLAALKRKDGACILIMNSPTGQMTHYLMRRFGKFVGGRQSSTRVRLPKDTQIIVHSKYPDITAFDPYENQGAIDWIEDWSRIIHTISSSFGDNGVRVGIIPDGTIQYWKPKGH